MSSYPATFYVPREMENRPGVLYEESRTKVIFAEDFNLPHDEIVAIQHVLGLNPSGTFSSVADRLDDIEGKIPAVSSGISFSFDVGIANTYAINPDPAFDSLSTGDIFMFRVLNSNTGASTLNVNSLGAYPITKNNASALASGDIRANQIELVAFNEILSENQLVDSYSESNRSGDYHVFSGGDCSAVSQSFVNTNKGNLTSCKFTLLKEGSPSGYCYAKLYAADANKKPTGSVLAISDAFVASSLASSWTLTSFIFSGDQQYEMLSSTTYCIVFEYSGGSVGNYIDFGVDSSSPSHSGQGSYYSGGSWVSNNSKDSCFYVYETVITRRFELLSRLGN